MIDHQIADNDGYATVDGGVTLIGDSSGDLDAGRCAVNIESVTEQDLDQWSCTLISKDKTIFTRAVHLSKPTLKYFHAPSGVSTYNIHAIYSSIRGDRF